MENNELAKDILQLINHVENNVDNGGFIRQYLRLVEAIKNQCIADRMNDNVDKLK